MIGKYGAKSPETTKHVIDVLVTQHAKWIASRIRRALLGQATTSEVAPADHERQEELAQKVTGFNSKSADKKRNEFKRKCNVS